MEEPLASVRFEQTVEDVVSRDIWISTRSGSIEAVRRSNLRIFGISLAAAVPLLSLVTFAVFPSSKSRVLVLAACGGLACVYGVGLARRANIEAQIKKEIQETHQSGHSPVATSWTEVSLFRDWFEVHDGTMRVEMTGDSLHEVRDDPEGVFLLFDDEMVVMVPRRAFTSAAERERFVGVARGLAGSGVEMGVGRGAR